MSLMLVLLLMTSSIVTAEMQQETETLPLALRTIHVSSISDLMHSIESARPGDHILLASGVYDTTQWLNANSVKTMLVSDISGTTDDPIVIAAEAVAGAEIRGPAGFQFRSVDHLVIRGFNFTHSQDNSPYTGDIAIRCDDCGNVRFTDNHFALISSNSSIESDWLGITSKESNNNRIDHNTFENKSTRGNFVLVLGKDGAMPQHNRIDHNHFFEHTYSSGNEIFGYYTTLSENGQVIQSGYSPVEFTVDRGQTYRVAVADYGQYAFDHWSDGSFDRFHDAQAGDSLTAIYRP